VLRHSGQHASPTLASSSTSQTPHQVQSPQFSPLKRRKRSGKVRDSVSCICISFTVTHSQTQNEYLVGWKTVKDVYLSELLSMEGPPSNPLCTGCQWEDACFRCLDCFGQKAFCQQCCIDCHQWTPFHCIRRWAGQHFIKTSLYDMGFVLHLGHNGTQCPTATQGDMDDIVTDEDPFVDDNTVKDDVMVIVDSNGVFHNHVRWCMCHNRPRHDLVLFCIGPLLIHIGETEDCIYIPSPGIFSLGSNGM
jgi:CxC2 like cysteine cluster associated with KDZ transposases